VALSVHSSDVERLAREYASHVGFPSTVVEDVALAGWLHDIGKVDRRFQIMLRGGSEIDFLAEETPWAKSAIPPGAKAAMQAARFRSGYPKGARHEVQSLAMLEKVRVPLTATAHDVDLVLHLVASHHGHCRPFAPAVEDHDPVDVVLPRHASDIFDTLEFGPTSSDNGLYRLDSPLADRFWQLVERYGWLELCWLEAVLRLADHRASEMEREGDG
jgi:CRISPR-associated endonuclease/helicase Cas3